jgi:uncharacterized oxidoreductase
MNLHGNTILITGGGSGIGLALAEEFAKLGNEVIVAARSTHKLEVAKNKGLLTIRADVSDAASIRALAERAGEEFPRLNVVIHNAAVCRREEFVHGDYATAREETIATNLLGPMRLTDALLPRLLQQKEAVVMVVTSGLAFVPSAFFPTYSATKAALHSYTQSLRFQLRNTSVKVLEIVPPYVQTQLGGPHQASDPNAMPLGTFVAEVMGILRKGPYIEEVLVSQVHRHRFAAEMGREDYATFFRQYNEARESRPAGRLADPSRREPIDTSRG